MAEPEDDLYLDPELVVRTRITALSRVIADYKQGETTISGANLPEVLANAKKIEEYLLNGTVPTT